MRECLGANTWVRPYALPNVGVNLVFAHYARFSLMPKSCGSTALCYTHSVVNPESNKSLCKTGRICEDERTVGSLDFIGSIQRADLDPGSGQDPIEQINDIGIAHSNATMG